MKGVGMLVVSLRGVNFVLFTPFIKSKFSPLSVF